MHTLGYDNRLDKSKSKLWKMIIIVTYHLWSVKKKKMLNQIIMSCVSMSVWNKFKLMMKKNIWYYIDPFCFEVCTMNLNAIPSPSIDDHNNVDTCFVICVWLSWIICLHLSCGYIKLFDNFGLNLHWIQNHWLINQENMSYHTNSSSSSRPLGAVPIRNEKGEITMQKVKVQRYISGRK